MCMCTIDLYMGEKDLNIGEKDLYKGKRPTKEPYNHDNEWLEDEQREVFVVYEFVEFVVNVHKRPIHQKRDL